MATVYEITHHGLHSPLYLFYSFSSPFRPAAPKRVRSFRKQVTERWADNRVEDPHFGLDECIVYRSSPKSMLRSTICLIRCLGEEFMKFAELVSNSGGIPIPLEENNPHSIKLKFYIP